MFDGELDVWHLGYGIVGTEKLLEVLREGVFFGWKDELYVI